MAALGPGGDPETKQKLQHARFQLPEPRETVRFAAFAGAWSARVTRPVAEAIADEVTTEFMGS
ncbi:MAG: hypothetical protein IPG34_19815 [Rhodocyclaceae bacterium]|nr:hypothetical protein [Rhodocyclaceae bacterium]